PVVAITGSSGKTSTKEMIRAVLATRYRTHATSGNLNNLVGVPLTILAAPDDAEALVAEAGASLPGEIARLRDVIEPTIAAITNVGYAHVEGFGSLGGVLREKVALVDGAGVAVVGTDPPELAREARRRTRTVWRERHPRRTCVPRRPTWTTRGTRGSPGGEVTRSRSRCWGSIRSRTRCSRWRSVARRAWTPSAPWRRSPGCRSRAGAARRSSGE